VYLNILTSALVVEPDSSALLLSKYAIGRDSVHLSPILTLYCHKNHHYVLYAYV